MRRGNPFRQRLWKELRSLLRRILVVGYFGYWSYKTDLRHKYLKRGAFVLVSLATALLAVEVLGETPLGAKRLHAAASFFSSIVKDHPHLANLAVFLFVAAVVFLFVHNFQEALSPGYEYVFVRRLCEYIETCPKIADKDTDARLVHALQLFHSVFERTAIAHVSIHSLEGDVLVIRRNHVFPPETDPAYFVKLSKGEGVAGKVFNDSRVRYVPRVYFPFSTKMEVPIWWKKRISLSKPFPHAVRFEYRTDGAAGSHIRGLEFTEEEPEVNIFKPSIDASSPFRAFLSVPIKDAKTNRCEAVLNFDFNRPDPLNKAAITMAAVFGLLLFDLVHEERGAVVP